VSAARHVLPFGCLDRLRSERGSRYWPSRFSHHSDDGGAIRHPNKPPIELCPCIVVDTARSGLPHDAGCADIPVHSDYTNAQPATLTTRAGNVRQAWYDHFARGPFSPFSADEHCIAIITPCRQSILDTSSH
jgi:hypothetical protein